MTVHGTSSLRGCTHAIFATAPSMNGYTSLSASITTTDGLKRSFRTRTPAGVYFDLRVLAAAPPRCERRTAPGQR